MSNCLQCQKEIFGSVRRKFCDTRCRISFNRKASTVTKISVTEKANKLKELRELMAKAAQKSSKLIEEDKAPYKISEWQEEEIIY